MSKPYYIIQRKIILKHFTSDFCQIDDELLSLIISFVYRSLIIKSKRELSTRLIRVMNLDASTYYQIQNEIHGLLGFNLSAKENGSFKEYEINSIGAHIKNFFIQPKKNPSTEISYEDFALCEYNSSDTFYINKINGCMYDIIIGIDILLLLMKYIYSIKLSKISKKKIKKLKLDTIDIINI